MHLKGTIKTLKSVHLPDKQECLGITKCYKQKFVIYLNRQMMYENPTMFLKVLLHELIHLYFFIVEAYIKKDINLTESKQHKLMGKYVTGLSRELINLIVKGQWK